MAMWGEGCQWEGLFLVSSDRSGCQHLGSCLSDHLREATKKAIADASLEFQA